jgi:7-cyano-7-deazaguanine synthase
MKKVILALSGGIDSTTVLAHLLDKGNEVECFGFFYGSKHNAFENLAAEKIARHYQVPFTLLDLSPIMARFRSNLLLSGGPIPEGHYTDASMSQTVVPGRNIIFLSILAGMAWSVDAQAIAIGIHQGDHAIYADCRREFYKAMDAAIYLGTDCRVEIMAPFLETDKIGIVKRGLELSVPYVLTRTCYQQTTFSCGKCGSCVERLEAFRLNYVVDPIIYSIPDDSD